MAVSGIGLFLYGVASVQDLEALLKLVLRMTVVWMLSVTA